MLLFMPNNLEWGGWENTHTYVCAFSGRIHKKLPTVVAAEEGAGDGGGEDLTAYFFVPFELYDVLLVKK